jgi:hypothetical protein
MSWTPPSGGNGDVVVISPVCYNSKHLILKKDDPTYPFSLLCTSLLDYRTDQKTYVCMIKPEEEFPYAGNHVVKHEGKAHVVLSELCGAFATGCFFTPRFICPIFPSTHIICFSVDKLVELEPNMHFEFNGPLLAWNEEEDSFCYRVCDGIAIVSIALDKKQVFPIKIMQGAKFGFKHTIEHSWLPFHYILECEGAKETFGIPNKGASDLMSKALVMMRNKKIHYLLPLEIIAMMLDFAGLDSDGIDFKY